jgi:hypothetical protein
MHEKLEIDLCTVDETVQGKVSNGSHESAEGMRIANIHAWHTQTSSHAHTQMTTPT